MIVMIKTNEENYNAHIDKEDDSNTNNKDKNNNDNDNSIEGEKQMLGQLLSDLEGGKSYLKIGWYMGVVK